jgi:hypothetical protein
MSCCLVVELVGTQAVGLRPIGTESTRVHDRLFGEIFYFCENFPHFEWGKFFILAADSAPLLYPLRNLFLLEKFVN